MTATDTRRQPAKRSVGGGSPHRARCEIRLWRTGGEDRCGLRFPGGHGPQLAACRHEQTASFMAAAISRLTGTRLPLDPATTSPTTGLLTANAERKDPVVALCGAVGREDRPKRTHQSIDAPAV